MSEYQESSSKTESEKRVKILLCGGAFRGNLGAAAMYDSIIDELRKYLPNIEVAVLSKYPNDDREECKKRGYRMIEYPTIKQLVQGGAFYIFARFLKLIHIPCRKLAGNGAIAEYFTNDILVDASGISFSDDRSLSNILINTLWFLPGIISGIPMVKMSQSMGPYKKRYVKKASRLVLTKLDFMVCRGNLSYELTKSFIPQKSIYNLSDTAFCLKAVDITVTQKILDHYHISTGKYIAIGPSYVMRDYFEPEVYSDIVSYTINSLAEISDLPFLFIPHSWLHKAQIGADTVNDDLSVCKEIASKLDEKVKYGIIDKELSVREIKGLIGQSYVAIGSRYHFLIAALSSGVPSMAMGWSHKYREVFQEFDIGDMVLEYQNMDRDNVSHIAKKLIHERENIKRKIDDNLDDVIRRSAENEKLIVKTLKNKKII